jgi:hypothetical protein
MPTLRLRISRLYEASTGRKAEPVMMMETLDREVASSRPTHGKKKFPWFTPAVRDIRMLRTQESNDLEAALIDEED